MSPSQFEKLLAAALPSAQKVQKAEIFPRDVDPKTLPGAFDLRSLKKRTTH